MAPLPPDAVGSALVVPMDLLNRLRPQPASSPALFARETAEVERIAMEAVMAAERRLGYSPRDVSAAKVGYDIESTVASDKPLRFIEVKGRIVGADTVTVTRNEILSALNTPDQFIMAFVEVEGDAANKVMYAREPFKAEPDFGATSVNYQLASLLQGAEAV